MCALPVLFCHSGDAIANNVPQSDFYMWRKHLPQCRSGSAWDVTHRTACREPDWACGLSLRPEGRVTPAPLWSPGNCFGVHVAAGRTQSPSVLVLRL